MVEDNQMMHTIAILGEVIEQFSQWGKLYRKSAEPKDDTKKSSSSRKDNQSLWTRRLAECSSSTGQSYHLDLRLH